MLKHRRRTLSAIRVTSIRANQNANSPLKRLFRNYLSPRWVAKLC